MTPPTAFELFAAFAAQLPILSREDLANAVDDLRQTPNWPRALAHARLQACALGLDESDFDPLAEVGARVHRTDKLLHGTT